MSNPTRWEVQIVRSIHAGLRDFPIKIDIRAVGNIVERARFVTTGQEFNSGLDTTGIFTTLQGAVESLASKVKAPFAVWAAMRWIDELIVVHSFPGGLPPDRYVRLFTSTPRRMQWAVDPADLHEPYGGSTTDSPLLRGSKGEARGLVTQSLVEHAIDEADVRNEPVGVISDGESPARYRVSWGQDLAGAPREMIAFVTSPPGDRSVFEHKR